MTLQAVGVIHFSSLCTRLLPRVLHLKLISYFIVDHGLFILTIVVLGLSLATSTPGPLPSCSYLVIHYFLYYYISSSLCF
jgi:hypothetical protein